MPKSVSDRTNGLINLEDLIESFIETKLVATGNDKDYVKRGQIFELYKAYCNSNSQRCKPRSILFNRLSDINVKLAKKDGYDVYRGIKIKGLEDVDDSADYDYGIEKIDQSIHNESIDQQGITINIFQSNKQEDESDEKLTKKPKSKKNKDFTEVYTEFFE